MATAEKEIITDSLNLEIVKTIPYEQIKDIFVELGFKDVDIGKRKVIAQLHDSFDDLIMSLLSSWKTQHGSGLDQAETLKSAMKKHKADEAVKLIQKAIDNVIPPPPRAEPLSDKSEDTSKGPARENGEEADQ